MTYKKTRLYLILGWLVCCLVLPVLPSLCQPQPAIEQRASNFIFLIDVSGSIVSKKTMVNSTFGAQITLFEALREALKRIVMDERLITTNSRISFITFGTTINDKAGWPESLKNSEVRKDLIEKISSSEELQADKHGDTYMAGALDKAYEKAELLSASSEPCATTFIIMLTDGWDEPPRGATLNVQSVARKIVNKQNEIRRRLGVNTWQVRVVGLQRLPERKAGTTTAAEVASLLGGEFLDIAKQSPGTVADRIAEAIRKTVSDLQGRVVLAPPDNGGIAAFGTIESGVESTASIRLNSRSCYAETLTGINDKSRSLTPGQVQQVRSSLSAAEKKGAIKTSGALNKYDLASIIPKGELNFRLKDGNVLLAPRREQVSKSGQVWQPVAVVAEVGIRCPPGNYLGALALNTTATADELLPFFISVPSRLVTDRQTIVCKIRKPGFFGAQSSNAEFKFQINAQISSEQQLKEQVTVDPSSAKSSKGNQVFQKTLINGGRPIVVDINTAKAEALPITVPLKIPAEQEPGMYQGVIKLEVAPTSKAIAPPDIHFTLDILPSPWEEVAPVAIPILAVFGVLLLLCVLIAVTMRR